MYQQHGLLKIRKLNLYLHLNPVPCPLGFASFKHLKLPIGIKIPVTKCLYLYNSHISKFDVMGYLFASLVVAWQ